MGETHPALGVRTEERGQKAGLAGCHFLAGALQRASSQSPVRSGLTTARHPEAARGSEPPKLESLQPLLQPPALAFSLCPHRFLESQIPARTVGFASGKGRRAQAEQEPRSSHFD